MRVGLACSDEGAARQPVHRADRSRVYHNSLNQAEAARNEIESKYQQGRDDRDYLLDSSLARPHLRDVFGNRRPAMGAHAAPFDDEVGFALRAFDFRS